MQKETVVCVDHVSHYYGDYCAVDDISFNIDTEEVVGFLGTNGSGKSTTMQMICGVLPISTGQIMIAQQDIFTSPIAAKKNIGFLPEHPPLYKNSTVDEYLSYAACLRGIEKKHIVQALQDSKQLTGLTTVGEKIIGNLSKGFQQRVGIAQAIIHKPKIVILDEPTAGLDPNQKLEIRKLICQLRATQSVILSTHVLAEVQSVCDRVLIINNSKLVLDAPTNNLPGDSNNILLKLAFKHPPTLEILSQIDGINKAQKIDEQHFSVLLKSDVQDFDHLLKLALESEWGLYEMMPIQNTLEDIFTHLTKKT